MRARYLSGWRGSLIIGPRVENCDSIFTVQLNKWSMMKNRGEVMREKKGESKDSGGEERGDIRGMSGYCLGV